MHRSDSVSAPADLVLVPAIWTNPFPSASWHAHFNACVYQRKSSDVPAYCPNEAYEGGIYLRYIIDHYYQLTNITVFIQEDANDMVYGKVKSLRHDVDWGWTPVGADWKGGWSQGGWIAGRSLMAIWGGRPTESAVRHCWRSLLQVVNYTLPNKANSAMWNPLVNLYVSAYFAVTRNQIHKHTLSVYRDIYYRLVERRKCNYDDRHEQNDILNPDNWDRNGRQKFSKDASGGAMEHLNHVILGGRQLEMKEFATDDWCLRFHDC